MRLMIMALALVGCSATGSDDRAKTGNETKQADDWKLRRGRELLAQTEALLVAPGVVSAPLGGVARLKGREIRPLAIVENSLCPEDVTCAWPGRLRLKVSISGVPGEPVLDLQEPFALPGGDQVILVAIAPPRFQTPPPGLDLSGPRRFGFRSGQKR